ncbi:RNA methyltransferase [Streptomyces sp. NPDC093261]|uniref:RNA methyltransferase n=1 Tax=Streptomyces sp. NPDC093261 TaxID=3366037 RepID=UPI0038301103
MNRGFTTVGVFHPKREVNIGGLWRAATIYGASQVFTVGARYHRQAADTPKTPQNIPLVHFADIDDLVAHLPWSTPLVGVELVEAATSLTAFEHPVRACYLLGAEDHGLPPAVLKRCHQLIQIPAPRLISHNVATAGALVLHDRYVKSPEAGR